MPTPCFPAEITDLVISFVWPDKQTLLRCALVCSTWLPASRHQLFFNICIRSTTTYDLLVSHVLRSQELAVKRCLWSVRYLDYMSAGEHDYDYGHLQRPRRDLLQSFAGHLPNLETLRMVFVSFTVSPFDPPPYLIASRYESLRHLILTGCVFPTFTTLRRTLASFPSLSNLSMQGVTWPDVSSAPVDALTWPALVRVHYSMLDGYDRYASQLFRWLSQSPSRDSMRALDFTPGQVATRRIDLCADFLRPFASSVSQLDIPLLNIAGGSAPTVLSLLTNLRDLTITTSHWSSASDHAIMARMLTSVTTRIKHLRFRFQARTSGGYANAEFFHALSLVWLDPVLETRLFDALETVTVRFEHLFSGPAPESPHVSTAYEQILESIRGHLPKLSARVSPELHLGLCACEGALTQYVSCGPEGKIVRHASGRTFFPLYDKDPWVQLGQ